MTTITQAAFEANWPSIGSVAPTGAVLTTSVAQSAPNAVQVPGTATTGQYRNRRSFSETGTISTATTIIWSFDFYDSNDATAPQRNYANLQESSAPSLDNRESGGCAERDILQREHRR